MLIPGPRPTIVLVHGAFANTSTWSKLIPLLVAKGFSVVAVHCPLSSLADDDAKVRGLVCIAAAAPDPGESFNAWWMGSPPAPGAPEIRPYGAGSYVVLTLQGFRDHFGQDLASDETTLLHATQGPFAQASNDEKITNAAWRDKPSWFVLGENDHMLLPELEKATAQKLGAKTLVLSSSHLPMLSQPYAVADFIEEAASQLGSDE
jgi:pimeloyl-ACP methyl ester carboxylesterase